MKTILLKQMLHTLEDMIDSGTCSTDDIDTDELMMNVLYSDHSESVRKYVPENQIPMFFYEQAIEKLEDPDRKNFIRSYFNL